MRKVVILLFISSFILSAKTLSITGTVVSNNQKMIGARYMGYVKKIYFDIGDKVKREDTLFELESAEFDILKNQAELALEQAEIMVDMYRTRMDSIKRERRILQRLKDKGDGNIPDLDDLDSIADNVASGLAAAQALVKSAAIKVKQIATISDYLEVKAPNDGIIVQKRIQVGDLIAPGMLTMVLVDLNHLEIDAQIAESDLSKIKKGKKVEIKIPSLNHSTIGYVKTIVPSANPMAHTFTLIVKFKKDNPKIYPGMYAKLKIKY
jgi:multidrug resistance efflux pump